MFVRRVARSASAFSLKLCDSLLSLDHIAALSFEYSDKDYEDFFRFAKYIAKANRAIAIGVTMYAVVLYKLSSLESVCCEGRVSSD